MIGVGVVHFEPFLVAALDLVRRCLVTEAQSVESFGFERLELSLLATGRRLPLSHAFASIERFCRA